MFIDTHAHLNMPEFSDLSEVIDRAKMAYVEAIINVSFDMDSSLMTSRLSSDHDFIYGAVGIHPHDAELATDSAIEEIKKLLLNKKIIAIGETGLDYYRCLVQKEIQQAAFRKFIRLSQDEKLPLIVHCREADEDVIRIMREENRGDLRAVFHCFAGNEHLMEYALDMGFMISFTGNITFKKADILRERVRQVPIENLMIETDCPYLSPEPLRGRRNEPVNVVKVAEAIALIKEMKPEDIAIATTANARRFFGIKL